MNKVLLYLLISLWIVNPGLLQAKTESITNGSLNITFDTEEGTWSCSAISGEKIISNAAFLIITENGEKFYSSSLAGKRKQVL